MVSAMSPMPWTTPEPWDAGARIPCASTLTNSPLRRLAKRCYRVKSPDLSFGIFVRLRCGLPVGLGMAHGEWGQGQHGNSARPVSAQSTESSGTRDLRADQH